MDYEALQTDLLRALRGRQVQARLSKKMGFQFNQSYRWESGRTAIGWNQFVRYCQACKADLPGALKKAFSYVGRPDEAAAFCRHFLASRKQLDFAREVGVSRYVLSRWLGRRTVPSLAQMLAVMDVGSIDFHRFLELLTKNAELPSIAEDLRNQHAHLALYDRFPWLSILLCALSLDEYRENPTMAVLSRRARLPVAAISEAIEALNAQGLLQWNGRHWEITLPRISIRSSVDSRRQLAHAQFARIVEGIDPGFGTPATRYSWKQFNLNEKHFELLQQKYTEFFNELGQLIEQCSEPCDKVYLFGAAFVDLDVLPMAKGGPHGVDRPKMENRK